MEDNEWVIKYAVLISTSAFTMRRGDHFSGWLIAAENNICEIRR